MADNPFSQIGDLNQLVSAVTDAATNITQALNGSSPANNNIYSQIATLSNQNNYASSIMLRGLNLATIVPADWSRVYPYRFVILQANTDGTYADLNLSVLLPITPQDIQLTTPFASQLSITSKGILEEHNGIKIKNLMFTASTGINIQRPAFTAQSSINQNIQTIFAGTIQAASNFVSAVSSLFPASQTNMPDPSSDQLQFSGYYQYHVVRAFLELYAQLKESPAGAGYRLGFEMGKDRVIYLLTPQNFVTKRSASSPLEYTYTFSGTAWGTVNQNNLLSPAQEAQNFLTNNISDAQKVLNAIRNARNVIQSAEAVVTAVQTDIQTNILGPINNIILAMKEAVNLTQTVADFPKQLQLAYQNTIVQNASTLAPLLPANVQGSFLSAAAQSLPESVGSGSATGIVVTSANVLNDVNITDNLPISSISMTPAQQQATQDAISTAAATSNGDLEKLIVNLQNLNNALEAQALAQGPDSPLWNILYAVNDTVSSTYSLLSDNFFGNVTSSQQAAGITSLMNFYQGYAFANGLNFTIPKSKFSIPFPFKVTLEWLAQRYLGDATRWIEIAALNNLQAPYVDEDGFYYNFLTNGNSNQFNVNSDMNLFVGQSVWIMSNTQPISKRTVQSIQQISTTNFLITVNGNGNLGSFTLSDKAKMKAYLPNTVNSQKLIYIPLDTPSGLDGIKTTSITFLDETSEMLALAKIDWLLDSQGDLAVSADGYQNLAYGKQNLIQAAKMKLSVVVGQLLLHSGWGAGVAVGSSEADLSLTNLAQQIRATFAQDSRFSSVDQIDITVNPGSIRLRVVVTATGISGIIPIDFEVQQ